MELIIFMCVCVCVCVVNQVYFQYFRQTLTFLNKTVSPIIPSSAEYLSRGALHCEFITENLWSPIPLMRISDPQAQVKTYFMLLTYIYYSYILAVFVLLVFIKIVDALDHLATKKN